MLGCLKMPERPWEARGSSLCPVPGARLSFELKLICISRAALSTEYLSEQNFVKSIYYLRHKLLSTYFLIRMSISVDSSPLLFWVLIHKLTQIWRFSVILMGAWGISFLGLPQNECLKQQELSVSQLCRFGVWIKVQMGSCSLRKL